MATSYSANQYENAFMAKRLHGWEVPKATNKRPTSGKSLTYVIADVNGHLLSGYKLENSAKSSFVSTWDLPKRLPGNQIDNSTARDSDAYEKLRKTFAENKLMLTGKKFNYHPSLSSFKQRSREAVTSSCQADATTNQTQGKADAIEVVNDPVAINEAAERNRPTPSNKIPLPEFSRDEDLSSRPENLVAL